MWRAYNEFKFSPEEWVHNLRGDRHRGAHYSYLMHRILRRAGRDKIITRAEQTTLWTMIKASDEDCLIAIIGLDNKYKQLNQKQWQK